ncbi:MAG: hypothetical protein GTO60_17135 [Gammaproteobacteria bacterium]|nr:hypothetical protein [Gammaproteobacteria bacterium]
MFSSNVLEKSLSAAEVRDFFAIAVERPCERIQVGANRKQINACQINVID